MGLRGWSNWRSGMLCEIRPEKPRSAIGIALCVGFLEQLMTKPPREWVYFAQPLNKAGVSINLPPSSKGRVHIQLRLYRVLYQRHVVTLLPTGEMIDRRAQLPVLVFKTAEPRLVGFTGPAAYR